MSSHRVFLFPYGLYSYMIYYSHMVSLSICFLFLYALVSLFVYARYSHMVLFPYALYSLFPYAFYSHMLSISIWSILSICSLFLYGLLFPYGLYFHMLYYFHILPISIWSLFSLSIWSLFPISISFPFLPFLRPFSYFLDFRSVWIPQGLKLAHLIYWFFTQGDFVQFQAIDVIIDPMSEVESLFLVL